MDEELLHVALHGVQVLVEPLLDPLVHLLQVPDVLDMMISVSLRQLILFIIKIVHGWEFHREPTLVEIIQFSIQEIVLTYVLII